LHCTRAIDRTLIRSVCNSTYCPRWVVFSEFSHGLPDRGLDQSPAHTPAYKVLLRGFAAAEHWKLSDWFGGEHHARNLVRWMSCTLDVLPPDRKSSPPDEAAPEDRPDSAAGRAQGIALEFGKGRIVVLSDAAMLTAGVPRISVWNEMFLGADDCPTSRVMTDTR
jgi:hypothetical protein